MKKFIFFANNLHIGGLEKSLVALLNAIDTDKISVDLVLEDKSGELLDELKSSIRVSEYRLSKCRIVPVRKIINFFHRLLWSVLRRNKYDFSCSYCTYSVIGSRLMAKCSENSSLYIHSNYFAEGRPAEDGEILKLLNLNRFAHLLFVSNESMRDFTAHFPYLRSVCAVVNNLIDCSSILKMSKEPISDFTPSHPSFLFVGRLEEESKKLSRLIKSFQIAHNYLPESTLIIVGSGKDKALCEGLIDEYNLSRHIVMVGSTLNPYAYMNYCDCVVLTSDYEGFPVIYYEALLLGKPLITTQAVSDDVIDISDFAYISDKTAESVARGMINYTSLPAAAVNIAQYNNLHLSKFLSIALNTNTSEEDLWKNS